MIYIAKASLLYAVAIPVFIWSWLCEQPHAVRMAWWDSFGSVPSHLRKRN